jgi:hypothetical protein
MSELDTFPAPHLPPELICFIIAFVVAGAISEKHLLEIGVPLTYVLIKLWQYLEAKYKLNF